MLIGRIGAAHGLSGEFRVWPLTDDPDRFLGLGACYLTDRRGEAPQPVRLESSRVLPNHVLVRLSGIDKREDAAALTGRYLAVDRSQAVILPEDSWFICDLIGCAVYDSRLGYLGTIHDVIQNGAQDLLEVRLAGAADLYIPNRRPILLQVDLDAMRINVDLPDGLAEVYR